MVSLALPRFSDPVPIYSGEAKKMMQKNGSQTVQWIVVTLMLMGISLPGTAFANDSADEALYRRLSGIATGQGDSCLLDRLASDSINLDWDRADKAQFVGNLRIIKSIREATAGKGD
jgi:hypothetical protein